MIYLLMSSLSWSERGSPSSISLILDCRLPTSIADLAFEPDREDRVERTCETGCEMPRLGPGVGVGAQLIFDGNDDKELGEADL